jgi:hypothetical protein
VFGGLAALGFGASMIAAGPANAEGSQAESTITIGYSRTAHAFQGRVGSEVTDCVPGRHVTVYEDSDRHHEHDRAVGSADTDSSGAYSIPSANPSGRYYAVVDTSHLTGYRHIECDDAKTGKISLPVSTGGGIEVEGHGHTGDRFPVKFEIDDVQRTSAGHVEGNFEFSSRSRHLKFESSAVLSLTRTHNVASFTASGELNGHSGYTVSVTAVDMRHSSNPSRISIELRNSSGTVVFSSNGLRHVHDGDIAIENEADGHGADGASVEP